MVKIFLLLNLCLQPALSQTKNIIKLSQAEVAQRILSLSDRSQEIQLRAEQNRDSFVQTLSSYDFALAVESGYESSKLRNFTNTQNDRDETLKTTASLRKPWTTGTLFGLEYTQTSLKSTYPITYTGTLPSQQTQNLFGVTLEQSILKNFFGRADRAKVRAAEKSFQASEVTRNNDLQDLVLDGIRKYWATYVAQETFQEALNSRERYQKLVEAVRKKTSFGYSNPGELSQVQAELEVRNQKVKTESNNFLTNLESLLTTLKYPAGTEIEFVGADQLLPPPSKPEKKIESLRAIRSLQYSFDAARDSQIVANSAELPDLAVVGRYYQAGLDASTSSAYNDMWNGVQNKYYIGLKLGYNFGSGVQKEDARAKRFAKQQAEITLRRRQLETADSLSSAERRVQASFAIAESAKLQKQYREKASQELNRSYTQGRTDISTLIISMNNFFDSEISFAQSIGNYQVALNEWAALRDELILDQNMKLRNFDETQEEPK